MADEQSNGGTRPLLDETFADVLGSVRDGTLAKDTDHDVLALCERYHVGPAALNGVLRRLREMGLARLAPTGATVRFTHLDPATWAEGSWMLVGLVEVAMRSAAPAASDDDLQHYGDVVARARRAAAERGDELDPAVFATIEFWAERTPDLLVAHLLRQALAQVRYGLAIAAPWQVTDIESWVASSLQALRLRDRSSAERAAHVFARLWAHHLEHCATSWGLEPQALLSPTGASSSDMYWSDWQPDDPWFELLGSLRDGSLEPGHEYTARGLSARFRIPVPHLLPMLDRLEVMGLVRPGDGLDASVTVTRPTLTDWSETLALLLGLQEMCARTSVARLTDDDREQLAAITLRIRRQARTKDYAYTSTLLELNRFFAAHSPNRAMRHTTTVVISRLAYILPEPPPFRQWEIEDFLQLIEEAVRTGEPDIASEACHALAAHFDAHIADVTARYESMGP